MVNGRSYPLWSQFVHRKDEWIGGVLEDFGDQMDRIISRGMSMSTEIVDISLKENGKEHAWFQIKGKDFTCGFCTSVGGVKGGETGWITFSGYMDHTFRIKQPDPNAPKPEKPLELPLT